METLDRSGAIKVEGTGVQLDQVVEVCGELSTSGGERVITNALIRDQDESHHLRPVAPVGTHGWEMPGMLITALGKVLAFEDGYFYVDDGSGCQDGTGNVGIRVDSSLLSSTPSAPCFALVTGVIGVEEVESGVTPMIRPRVSGDFGFLPL